MIAGAGNFPSGSPRCESFLYNPTIAGENGESRASSVKNAGKACKSEKKIVLRFVIERLSYER